MDDTTVESMVRGYEIDRDRVEPEARPKETDVVGAARILGAQVTAVSLKPRDAGTDTFDQAAPRHGYLAYFTATVSVSSRPGEYVKVTDITVKRIDVGVELDE